MTTTPVTATTAPTTMRMIITMAAIAPLPRFLSLSLPSTVSSSKWTELKERFNWVSCYTDHHYCYHHHHYNHPHHRLHYKNHSDFLIYNKCFLTNEGWNNECSVWAMKQRSTGCYVLFRAASCIPPPQWALWCFKVPKCVQKFTKCHYIIFLDSETLWWLQWQVSAGERFHIIVYRQLVVAALN